MRMFHQQSNLKKKNQFVAFIFLLTLQPELQKGLTGLYQINKYNNLTVKEHSLLGCFSRNYQRQGILGICSTLKDKTAQEECWTVQVLMVRQGLRRNSTVTIVFEVKDKIFKLELDNQSQSKRLDILHFDLKLPI